MEMIHRTEVDGVMTIWAEASPPYRAALLFRTGRADESLATSGQTHLIEHLTLSKYGELSHRLNGFVGGSLTGFMIVAQPDEVRNFLSDATSDLSSLPADRLESEKQVLAAENASRPFDLAGNLLMWRYGAEGYGLLGLPELGIRRASLEALKERSEQRFAAQNAVLWMSGPPPEGLELNLPHGKKYPPPTLDSMQEKFPSWFLDNASGGVSVGAIVPRVSASTAVSELASRRLREQLRMTRAISYAPAIYYDHLTSDQAHLVFYADSEKEHRKELAGEFSLFFEGFDSVEKHELESVQKEIYENWVGSLAPSHADGLLIEIQRAAMDHLFGREFESKEVLAAELMDVSVDDVIEFIQRIKETAMFALPSEAELHACFGEKAPESTVPVVEGRKLQSVDAPVERARLVHGSDGVSLVFPNAVHHTVRFADLAGALYYEDGGVCLIGNDAVTVMVEPTLWRGGLKVCQQIRAQVPEELVLEVRTRPDEAIPKPYTSGWQRFLARLTG